MKTIKLLLLVGVIIIIIDNLLTYTYCSIQKKKELYYLSGRKKQKVYTLEEVHNYKFPKKQVKWIFHLYKGWIRYKLHRLGKIPCHTIRNFFLRHIYLMILAKTAVLYGGFEVRSPWRIEIGEGSVIGDESKLDGRNGLIIGKNVNFSTGVWIWTEQHDLNDSDFGSNNKGGEVIIGDRAWVSSRTTILPRVKIGEGCVIAAGAVISKDCEAFGIYGGVPGKKIGERSHNLKYIFDGSHEAFW